MAENAEDDVNLLSTKQLSTLLQELWELRERGSFCDVVVEVQSRRYLAHKAVLSSTSGYFRSLFLGAPCSSMGPFVVDFVSMGTFEQVLGYVYRGDVTVSRADVRPLRRAARKLELRCLVEACEPYVGCGGEDDDNDVDVPAFHGGKNKGNCDFNGRDNDSFDIENDFSDAATDAAAAAGWNREKERRAEEERDAGDAGGGASPAHAIKREPLWDLPVEGHAWPVKVEVPDGQSDCLHADARTGDAPVVSGGPDGRWHRVPQEAALGPEPAAVAPSSERALLEKCHRRIRGAGVTPCGAAPERVRRGACGEPMDAGVPLARERSRSRLDLERLECHLCGARFAYVSEAVEHALVHMGVPVTACAHCGRRFASERPVGVHASGRYCENCVAAACSALATPRMRAHAVRRGARSAEERALHVERAASPAAAGFAPRPKTTDEVSAAERSDKEPVPCRPCDLVLCSADERKEHEEMCGQEHFMCRPCERTFRTAYSLWRHRQKVHHDSETFAFLSEGRAAQSLSLPEAAAEAEREESGDAAATYAASDSDIAVHSSPLRAVYLASTSAAKLAAYSLLLSLPDAEAARSLQSKDVKVEYQDTDANFVTVEVNSNEGDDSGDDHNDDFQESQVGSAILSSAGSPAVKSGAEIGEDKTKPQHKRVYGLANAEEELAHASCRKPRLVRLNPVSPPPPPRLRRDGAAKARQLKVWAVRADRRITPLVTAATTTAAAAAADAESPPRPEPSVVAAAQDVDLPHTCTKCGVVFSLLQDLERHQEMFCEVKAFNCHDCDKSFRTNFRLWSHRQSSHWDGDAASDSHSG
uniref:Zinc finger and BTB domain-containing protein 21 n=1 Tax=Petromyzon marinus TaxID=7757 RepID=A0AAJ7U6X7_PETMA|nr:zinc finger and BTB domain-containing protein 21 [Petromyzon marinus]XP_032830859.1 zinc finger and BTB domain-containing protein 21 [Petromyzon marinus]XP_032830860.1 zinc finger and BTB domain-containing protein 21 [Petromyzon marinus]